MDRGSKYLATKIPAIGSNFLEGIFSLLELTVLGIANT